LGLNQSQYSRREKGEIPFIPNEIQKLSVLLETSISDLFGEKIASSDTVLIHEKLIAQYELRIKEKDQLIEILKSQINISS
jgi:transcriptional regulator with XRE-family HTH domain